MFPSFLEEQAKANIENAQIAISFFMLFKILSCKYADFSYKVADNSIKIVHIIAPTVPIAYPNTASNTPTEAREG